MLNPSLPAIADLEDDALPQNLPPVIDAHVHLFPDKLFEAVWQWFDAFGWPIRHKMGSEAILSFLFDRGVSHIIGLQYAHKLGVARDLNRYMASLCARHDRLTGMATVFPGEPEAGNILIEGFNLGLKGVKLHAHVQCFEMQSPSMKTIYQVCSDHGRPLVIHAGREPKSQAYLCDPHLICSAGFVRQVLRDYPDLRVCVPHLGADEFDEYARMLEQFDNLWLDTTMMLADYLPCANIPKLSDLRSDRIMFGTDFPNLPYAWDREIKRLAAMALPKTLLSKLLHENAMDFFKIHLDPSVGLG
jgi:predicted TIM-barrel fold metal-dependent hydrolase